MSLKPMAPGKNNPADRERYRRDMAAYYANPEQWGWVGSQGPKPDPGKCSTCKGPTYLEHGEHHHLGDGIPASAKCKVAPTKK